MDNRELATFILLGLGLAVALMTVRPGSALKILLAPKLAASLLFFAGWTALAVWLAHSFGLWTTDLIAGTILWFIFVGIVWFLHLNDAGKDTGFFKRRVAESVSIGAMFEFFFNLESMSLPAELVFQVALLFVVLVHTVASLNQAYKQIVRPTTGVLVLFMIGLTIFTVVQLVGDWHSIQPQAVVNIFALPIWLTVAALPCIYLIALFVSYGSLFSNLRLWNDGHRPTLRSLGGVTAELRWSLIDIDSFCGLSAKPASITRSFSEARQAVRDFKRARAEDQAVRAQARDRLVQNTGVTGVGDDGLVLDRREFAQTKKALSWLATCQMGWYRGDDPVNTYRTDLIALRGNFADCGLPEAHGISLKVRKDGQAWYAYRATPGGHVFGVGADGPPPSEWYYDGPKSPTEFPTASSGWTSFMQSDRLEWQDEAPID